ncbi:MAG: FtsX-like permease family protein [Bacteroidia bacterium]
MFLSRFIAKRLALGKFKSFASLIIRLAWIGVGLSVGVMILSIAIVVGYKKQISEKVLGFGGDIEIHSTGTTGSFDYVQFSDSTEVYNKIKRIPEVIKVSPVMSRPGILKANDDLEGIIFKGIDTSYDLSYLNRNLIRGKMPRFGIEQYKREILISKIQSKKMKLDTGDRVRVYFINDPVRVIPCTVTGIYETGLEETDMIYVIGSLVEMQRIFANKKNQITHYEVQVDNFNNLAANTTKINTLIPHELNAESLVQLNPQIFDWLGYLDQNISIILTLMVIVACINMITALLILIIERTNMIGVLKALGSRSSMIKKVFLNHALYILILGLIFGNILGLSLAFIQYKFQVITLPQETYYLSSVPIYIEWWQVLAVNIGTVLVCMIALLLPVRLIQKIDPVKAIRFN